MSSGGGGGGGGGDGAGADLGVASDYVGIVVVAGLACFWFGWAIGANNLANAFGTSVGAKSLNMWQACLVGSLCEIAGALALGAAVTETIVGSIARPSAWTRAPEIYMFGLLCALLAASLWVTVATYLELGVSTTHSIIGAVLAFTLVWGGASAVVWADPISSFPYYKGFVPIVISWFVAPTASLLVAGFTFLVNRTLILRQPNSTALAFWALPLLVFKTIVIDIFFILYRGAGLSLNWSAPKCLWVAAAAAGGCVVVTVVVIMPLLHRRLRLYLHSQGSATMERSVRHEKINSRGERVLVFLDGVQATIGSSRPPQQQGEGEAGGPRLEELQNPSLVTVVGMWDQLYEPAAPPVKAPGCGEVFQAKAKVVGELVRDALLHGVLKDIHEDISGDEQLVSMHQAAEIFEPQTEYVYKYLQIFSACCVSFAHGAKDSANAAGPFAGIWYLYNHMALPSDSGTTPCPNWILALAAAGIVTGLDTYGYNMMRVLGIKMAKMTPSRGYSAELSVALVVGVCTYLHLPISTTHCIFGAEIGVGMCESLSHGPNWRLFIKTATAWLFTVFISGAISALLFCAGGYTPSIIQTRQLYDYSDALSSLSLSHWVALNDSNSNTLGRYSPALAAVIAHNVARLTALGQLGFVHADTYVGLLNTMDQAVANHSLLAVGYNISAALFTHQDAVVPALP